MARAPSPAPQPAAPVLLVCGDDEFAIKRRARQVWDEWTAELGGMDHEILDAAAGNAGEALTALGRLREALQTLPFFGSAKAVWFQGCNFLGEDRTTSSAPVTEALAGLADDLKTFRWDGVRLLVSAIRPDRRRSLYKTLEKIGSVESFAALSGEDRDWPVRAEAEAVRILREAGREIDRDALADLVSRVGPDLRQLAQETTKLILYTEGQDRIRQADVEAVTTRQKQARAFALAEALGDRNLPALLRTLDEELWEIRNGRDRKKSEIGLLYGLISKVRTLLLLREMFAAGLIRPVSDFNRFKAQFDQVPPGALPADRRFNPLAGHPFVLFKASQQADNYTTPELVRAMGALLEANRQLVSSGLDEAMVLQRALVGIVGTGRRRGPAPAEARAPRGRRGP